MQDSPRVAGAFGELDSQIIGAHFDPEVGLERVVRVGWRREYPTATDRHAAKVVVERGLQYAVIRRRKSHEFVVGASVDDTAFHDGHGAPRLDRPRVDPERPDRAATDKVSLDIGGDGPSGQHRLSGRDSGAHVNSHQDRGDAKAAVGGGEIWTQRDEGRCPAVGAFDFDAVAPRNVFVGWNVVHVRYASKSNSKK